MMIAVLAVIGLVAWQMSKAKPAGATPQWSPGDLKPPTSEGASLPLNVWQRLTQEQLQGLPITRQTGQIGAEPYYKTSQPVAIGDTGFKIWGMTESGAVVVSKYDPATYDPWEWY